MSEPVKRGRGRPRKTEPVQTKPTNPDCEPATKGYVKCVARKIINNGGIYFEAVNPSLSINNFIGIVAFLFGIWWVAAVAFQDSTVAWVMGVASICMLSVATEMSWHKHEVIVKLNGDKEPAFQKYTPVCEEKKECE